MKSEFDIEKDAGNFVKHGVSLAFGTCLFDDREVVVTPTHREADEEDRYKAIGLVDGNLWTAVHVYRGEYVRFISVRRSNASEQRAYHSNPG